MKKIKLLIASMIGAIALVFAAVLGTKVTAATIVEKNETNTPTAVELDEEYTLSASTVNTGSSVGTSDTTITDAYGIFKFSGAKWGKYSSGTYLCARGNSNAYITVVLNANQKITYSMVAYCTKQSQHTYITLGGVNKVQTDDFSGDNAEKEVTISYTSTTDNNNVQLLFNNKLGFKTLTASVSNAAEEIDYTATFSLSGGSGTKPSDIKVSKTAEDKTITLPSSDGLSKVGHVFGGWNDGTTTYEAGAEYELTSDNSIIYFW